MAQEPKKPKLDLKSTPAFIEMEATLADMKAKLEEHEASQKESTVQEDMYDPMDEEMDDFWPELAECEDGEYQWLYPNSELLRWKFTCKNKKFDGEVENIYPTSQVKRRCSFVEGLLEGEDFHMMLNGELFMMITHKAGKMHGVTKLYRGGILTTEVEMDDDKVGGWCKNYHDNGKIGSLIRYKNGKMDGIMELFDDEGRKLGDITYEQDLKHGQETYYYPDASIRSENYFEKNLQEGEAKTYYPSGMLMQIEKFSRGVSITHSRLYDTEGRLMQVE